MNRFVHAVERLRIAAKFLRETGASRETMVWDGVRADGNCLADELSDVCSDISHFWRPIANLPEHETMVLAATQDGRLMAWSTALLRKVMGQTTPPHLRFPATHYVLLTDLPPLPLPEFTTREAPQ